MLGRALESLIVVGFVGGNAPGSKLIISPVRAFPIAQRSVPRPLSALLVTDKMLGLARERASSAEESMAPVVLSRSTDTWLASVCGTSDKGAGPLPGASLCATA